MSALCLALHTQREETQMGGCQRLGVGSWVFHGDSVSVGEDENVLEGTAVTVAQQQECT